MIFATKDEAMAFVKCYSKSTMSAIIIASNSSRTKTQLLYQCKHGKKQQNESKGTRYWAAHPSYVGKKDSKGAYLTGSLAAYQAKLNCRLATLINQSLTNGRPTS